ncbi:hypothetical protein MKEN_00621700 [Mycena kentingensis (nom. inval.)]|nr:hypothetical protein MKEN_00621700 [Mycena kentingensis (nom. inval.)]
MCGMHTPGTHVRGEAALGSLEDVFYWPRATSHAHAAISRLSANSNSIPVPDAPSSVEVLPHDTANPPLSSASGNTVTIFLAISAPTQTVVSTMQR